METAKSVIEVPKESFGRREGVPIVIPQATPMTMLAEAVHRGMDVATIKDLMQLQKEWEANEARKAYAVALAAFKENPPTVYKDKDNVQYGSKYASIGNLVNTVNVGLSAQGLSAHWDIDQSAGIKVTCILTHRAGHSEKVSMSGPADDSGKKNPLQQIKSTVTYLKIATFEAVAGIASADANQDDDGNGAGTGLDAGIRADFEAAIEILDNREMADKLWAQIAAACEKAGDVPNYADLKAKLVAKSKAFKKAT